MMQTAKVFWSATANGLENQIEIGIKNYGEIKLIDITADERGFAAAVVYEQDGGAE